MTKKFDDSVIDAEDIIGLGLLKHHTHMITGDINDETVDKAIRWLLYENATGDGSGKTLTLYINSTGGSLTDAFALIDIMRSSKFVVRTIGIGNVMSSAFLIFSAGDKGHRYVSKNTSGMCHQFTDSMDSKYHDIKSAMKESESLNERIEKNNEIIVQIAEEFEKEKTPKQFNYNWNFYFNCNNIYIINYEGKF